MEKLSDRIRPNSEAAPWVIEEVKELETEIERRRVEVVELKGILLAVFDISLGGLDESTQQAVGDAYRAALAGKE